MAQYYIIKGVKKGEVWHNDFGEFQGYSLSLEGLGEPVSLNKKVPVQQDPAPGDKLYGTVEMLMSKTGKTYSKFKTEKEPDDTYTAPSPQNQPQGSYVPHNDDKEDSIARAVALKAAVEFCQDESIETVLAAADDFVGWLKNGSGTQQAVVPTPTPETSNAVQSTPAATTGYHRGTTELEQAGGVQNGYDKARLAANKLRQNDDPLPEPPEDIADVNPGDYYEN